MRAAGFLLMFSSLARPYRIGAFCNKNVPRSHGKLSMSTSCVDLEQVAGDSIGGGGNTLVPKVCPIPLCAHEVGAAVWELRWFAVSPAVNVNATRGNVLQQQQFTAA